MTEKHAQHKASLRTSDEAIDRLLNDFTKYFDDFKNVAREMLLELAASGSRGLTHGTLIDICFTAEEAP